MDLRALTFDWNRARAFLVTVEEGSFSAASRALGVAQPTIGRQVAALEKELGVVLFERTGHNPQLTEVGLELAEFLRAMADMATQATLVATGHAQAASGTVRITASELTAAYLLPPVVAQVRAKYPDIDIELLVSNEELDLLRREADIAIRHYPATQSELVSRSMGTRYGRMVATPDYIASIGSPSCLAELDGAAIMAAASADVMRRHLGAIGIDTSRCSFPVMSPSHLVGWRMVQQGIGIGLIPDYIADTDPNVERLFPEEGAIPIPMWLTTHRAVRTSRRIRVVFDLIVAALSA